MTGILKESHEGFFLLPMTRIESSKGRKEGYTIHVGDAFWIGGERLVSGPTEGPVRGELTHPSMKGMGGSLQNSCVLNSYSIYSYSIKS